MKQCYSASTLFILLFYLSFPFMVLAQTTHYVSTTGDNSNDGSPGSPWRTIQYAIDASEIGDIIEVAAGIYNEKLFIPKPITINGAAGTLVIPPCFTPNKRPVDTSGPLVEITAGGKDSGSGKASVPTVTITGIEFNCDFHPYIHTGIQAIYYNLVFDNIKVHSILQENANVFGINISHAGSISITNSKIHQIISIETDHQRYFSSIGILIEEDQNSKSTDDMNTVIITDNEIFNISAMVDDMQSISPDEESYGIAIIFARDAMISRNKIYSAPDNIIQKDYPGPLLFSGPAEGIFLFGLGGENTISANEFSNLTVATWFWATPSILFADNIVSNCFTGFFGMGIPPPSYNAEKSNLPIPPIRSKLLENSLLKSNMVMGEGVWQFRNNTFDDAHTPINEDSFGIIILNFIGIFGTVENGLHLDVVIHGNKVHAKDAGVYVFNLSNGSYAVSGNVFSNNDMGLFIVNPGSAGLTLNVADNDFINNVFAGMGLNTSTPIDGIINQNTFEGNGIGLFLESGDFATLFANNNRFLNNVEFGIKIESADNEMSKSGITSLDATCNWWGTIDQELIAGMVDGDAVIFPYLLSDVTDPGDPAYNCGIHEVVILPLSGLAFLISFLLIIGFTVSRLKINLL